MILRPYVPADAEALLAVFRKNVPVAFAENEVDDYAQFLLSNNDPYFVAEDNGRVVGACGYYLIPERSVARICWILADPDGRGSGIGSALLQHVLNEILKQRNVALIECQTSQVAYRFFEKFGFVLHYTEPDHWAPGLDLYAMALDPRTSEV